MKISFEFQQCRKIFFDHVNEAIFLGPRVRYLLYMCCVLGCLLAVEAIPLHFTFFSKLWMEVYQKAGDVRTV